MLEQIDTPFVPTITLSQALVEPTLFGGLFAKPSFWTWRTVGKLIDGVALTEQREIDLFEECTGRVYNRHNRRAARYLLILAGRRAGKDRFFSAIATWRAALCTNWKKYLTPGEQAVVLLLGADKRQAAILRRYAHGLIELEGIKNEVARVTNEVIEFRNGSCLEIATNDPRLVRGRSAIAVLGSETCQWKVDEHSFGNDEEVVSAAGNSMGMCPDQGLLILGSSVHRRTGHAYRMYKELHGNNEAGDEDICWFAPSRTMNPLLPQSVIDRALAKDPHKAKADYLNIWREDFSECFPNDAVEACTDTGVYLRPPAPGIVYFAFTDAALGTGRDSFTLCIAHRLDDDVGTVVIDVLLERKPRFIPAEVVKEFAAIVKSYGISEISGDKTGGGFHFDEWARNGIIYKPAEFTTSEAYLRALPIVLAGRVRLLDNATLRTQLTQLERSVTGTTERVEHPKVASAHDDLATAVCGAMVIAGDRLGFITDWGRWIDDHDETKQQTEPHIKEQGLSFGEYFHAVMNGATYVTSALVRPGPQKELPPHPDFPDASRTSGSSGDFNYFANHIGPQPELPPHPNFPDAGRR